MKLPAYYIVGARPVKLVATAEGGMDCLAYDWDSGEFRREMRYLTRVTFPDVEVDEVDEREFLRCLTELEAELKRAGNRPP